MTDEAKALMEKLLRFDWRGKVRTATAHQAADLIETQAREIERLREALTDPSVVHANMLAGYIAKPWPKSIWHIYGRELLDAMPDEYRAALAGDSHE